MIPIFKKTKQLEAKIDEFLDTILQAALEFKQALKYYLNGDLNEFFEREKVVDRLEGRADSSRRDIENQLYQEMLIPESRGDVLALLENSDDVLNLIADTIVEFSIERPEIFPEVKDQFDSLVEVSIGAVEEMVCTMRSYFKNITAVRDHISKIMFFEKESDKIGEKIKRYIFDRDDIDLAKKTHLRTFITYIQNIADKAEDIGDRVNIYAIKRMM